MDDLAPMAEDPHPDEGAIHAWLESQLGADDAARVESHVKYCRACQARVDEARELIAESSRVVTSLDDPMRPFLAAPGDELAAARVRAGSSSLWRWARLTPARAALAASLLVALGVTLTQRRVAHDVSPSTEQAMIASAPMAARVPDHLLDSAVARRVAESQPQRTVEAATAPAMPAPAPPAAAGQLAQADAPSQVAQGRAEARVARETAPIVADQSRALSATSASAEPAALPAQDAMSNAARMDAPVTRRVMAAKSAAAGSGQAGAMASASMRAPAPAAEPASASGVAAPAMAAAQECYIVEPTRSGTRPWGPLSLPLVIALRGPASSRASARPALVVQGTDTTALSWTRTASDSVRVEPSAAMRGDVGFGSIMLGPGADQRTGIARTAAEASGVAVRTARGVRAASLDVAVVARRVVCPGS